MSETNKSTPENERPHPPVEVKEFLSHGVSVLQTRVQSEEAVKALQRERGLYTTIRTGPLDKVIEFEDISICLMEQLKPLLEPFFGKNLCICGIGNASLPHDALGPEVVKRFLTETYELFSLKSNFTKTVMISPGTKGQTNLSTETFISSIASSIDAAAVLAIDVCACSDYENLCNCIYLTDSGTQIQNGSGVIRQSTIGVPVIALAVPAIIPAKSLSPELDEPDRLLTTIHITETISSAAYLMACAINMIVYPDLSYQNCKELMGLLLHGTI